MFKVFISAASLEKLCVNEMTKNEKDQCEWFLILSKQKAIYVDKDVYADIEADDPLFIFSESYQISFKEADFDFNDLDNQGTILSNSDSAFLLDLDEGTVSSLQQKLGVICQSTNNLSECALATHSTRLTLITGEKMHSWKELFQSVSRVPSNSLVIIDRYIFGFQKPNHGYLEGLENIKSIIQNVLPKNLGSPYHILLIFDETDCSDRYYSRANVIKKLTDFINYTIKPSYSVIIEMLSVNRKSDYYEATHNRKILSNYFSVTAENLLKAFDRNGNGICDQDLTVEYLYTNSLNNQSDSAVRKTDRLLSLLSDMYKDAVIQLAKGSAVASPYQYECFNDTTKSINGLSNRLIHR